MLTYISSTNNSSVCQAVLSASTLSASTAALSHVNTGSRYALPTVCFGPPRRPSACRQLSAELGFTEQQSAELLPPAAVLLWGCRGNLQPLFTEADCCAAEGKPHCGFTLCRGGGEKGEEILLRIFTFHTVKRKQNKTVLFPHPNRRFICSAKLTKCLLCPRLIAA